MGHRDDACPGTPAGSARARRPTRRRGGWWARRAAAGRAAAAAAGTARRGASRRPRAFVTSASPGGRRSASIAISSCRSRSHRFVRVDLVLQAPRLVRRVSSESARPMISSKRSSERSRLGDRLLDVLEHGLRRVELRLLRQEADARARRPGTASPTKSLSTPAMMRSSVLLPAPFAPSTPIFAPPVERQPDALQDLCPGGMTLRRSFMVKMNSGMRCLVSSARDVAGSGGRPLCHGDGAQRLRGRNTDPIRAPSTRTVNTSSVPSGGVRTWRKLVTM